MQPLICIMGPTASGKTRLATELVNRFPLAIISVDSAMVYRGMDIGTAKPNADTLKQAPHRLLDIRDPKDAYSAAQFRDDALAAIAEIRAAQKTPLLVGGTLLYFRALLQGLATMPSANTALREKLVAEANQLGWIHLHTRLASIDPDAASRIHQHDTQRIQRALEVYELTGKTLTAWQQEQTLPLDNNTIINIVIAPLDRTILHERIAKRFTDMLDNGFIEEVKTLYQRGDLSLDTPAIRSVGYRQAWHYLQGDYSFAQLREKGIIATRQLAKRQLTWLRSLANVTWFDSESSTLVTDVENFLKTSLLAKSDIA